MSVPAPRPGTPRGTSAPAPSRGLSAGWIVFIVLDVLLVAAAVVFAVVVFSGSSGPGQAQPTASSTAGAQTPAGTASPSASASSDRPSGTPTTFTSPSRNITCTIDETGARCGIAELAAAPAPVAECDGTVGYVFVVNATQVDVPCTAAADQPAPAGQDVQVLEYDQQVQEFGFTCESSREGMACSDDVSGKGFRLARAGGETF